MEGFNNAGSLKHLIGLLQRTGAFFLKQELVLIFWVRGRSVPTGGKLSTSPSQVPL
jgi:hypothetical protein